MVRYFAGDDRSSAQVRFDSEFAPESVGPVFHRRQAQASHRARRWIDALPVVGYGQAERGFLPAQSNRDSLGVAVLDGIVHRLLCNSVKVHPIVEVLDLGIPLLLKGDRHAPEAGGGSSQILQSDGKSGPTNYHGEESTGQILCVRDRLVYHLADLLGLRRLRLVAPAQIIR